MTISNPQASVTVQGDGVTTQFSYQFLIPAAQDVIVSITDTTVDPPVTSVVASTLYTITGLGLSEGGLVTYPLSGTPLAAGIEITIARTLLIIQTAAIGNQGNFYPSVVEGALDYLTMVCQDLQSEVDDLTRADITVISSITNSVATVALLKAAIVSAPLVGTSIYLQGYYAANDGGQGIFQITNVNPGADNGGTVIWSNTLGFYFVRLVGGEPLSLRWFGAKGDYNIIGGTGTDDATAIANWLAAIPEDCAGYIPPANTGDVYKTSAAMTRNIRGRIFGDGLLSHIHYTGSGVAFTWDHPRFSSNENWYLTGTSAASGGFWAQEAQEGYHQISFFVDSFTGASAWAMRFSDSWTYVIMGGAARQSTTGLWCDTTGVFKVNNSVIVIGLDCSACTIGLDYQQGTLANFIGLDFSGCITMAEFGRAIPAAGAGGSCVSVNVTGCYGETTNGYLIGRGSDVAANISHITFLPNSNMDCTGDMFHLYRGDLITVEDQRWGTGTCTIEAGCTRINWNTLQTVTNNAGNNVSFIRTNDIDVLSITATVTITFPVLGNGTVAQLGSASPGNRRAWVTDANATTFNAIVAGGGSNSLTVYADGTNWRIGG